MAGEGLGQIVQPDQAKLVLLAKPAKEQPGPLLLLLLLEPHLQPMALILPGDLKALAHRTLQLREQGGEVLLGQGWLTAPQGLKLALHQKIAVASDRRCGLHVGPQPEAEVRCR